jgi:DNA polymerase I
MRTLLIDGDAVTWSVAFRPPALAAELATKKVRKLMGELTAERAVIAFGDPSRRYFRHDLIPAYKARRSPQPAGYGDAFAAIAAMGQPYMIRWLPGLEADDVLGILATHPAMAGERVIVSNDKDLLSVPGTYHDFAKDRAGAVLQVPPQVADWRHLYQTLTGDGSDGYGGCPGIGPAKACRIIDSEGDPAEWWPRVVEAFAAKGLTEADALLQARLARVLRATDYDVATRQVRLWTPAPAGAVTP